MPPSTQLCGTIGWILAIASTAGFAVLAVSTERSKKVDACEGAVWQFVDADPEQHCLSVGERGIERLHDNSSKCSTPCEHMHHQSLAETRRSGRRRLQYSTHGQAATVAYSCSSAITQLRANGSTPNQNTVIGSPDSCSNGLWYSEYCPSTFENKACCQETLRVSTLEWTSTSLTQAIGSGDTPTEVCDTTFIKPDKIGGIRLASLEHFFRKVCLQILEEPPSTSTCHDGFLYPPKKSSMQQSCIKQPRTRQSCYEKLKLQDSNYDSNYDDYLESLPTRIFGIDPFPVMREDTVPVPPSSPPASPPPYSSPTPPASPPPSSPPTSPPPPST